MSIPITAHFTASEFDCHDGSIYPPEWYTDRLVPLCTALEVIREACGGRAIEIVSGYRSPEYNAARARNSSGVATDSQHPQGRAADARVNGMTAAEVHAIVLRLDAEGKIKIGGLGLYPDSNWCHVDVRERAADGHLERWVGK